MIWFYRILLIIGIVFGGLCLIGIIATLVNASETGDPFKDAGLWFVGRLVPWQVIPGGAWLVASLLLIGVSWFAIPRTKRKRRVKLGQCPACGYDLQGSSGAACPECGQATATTG